MQISYDITKNQVNIQKHGVSLALAGELEWDSLFAVEDARKDYGETRFIGFALMGDRLYCVVFTDRGESRRIISLRKANDKEKMFYVSHN
jgi:uncharacterized protein